ncbi:hypothetical protein FRACYDRAFT_250242 [Fragilariopsis cylindrus CCMP1102]|uniref:tRNA-uridine aminocarboxypropyltransferase n=1 Tax=Fragilariopsis cylindrus CCMP1102 TaxID=635003 RepID=A0A1E7EPZ0_9STRA|nr:hypothetical protein FRACYDRAFT_250242 [Fragilariopsis cylindrus CCMP1102]|eukprot:OEU08022.1 hypothetical protein FRACYDRAFT_250242 [Fragilariopsis cylindrus CCMP1102]
MSSAEFSINGDAEAVAVTVAHSSSNKDNSKRKFTTQQTLLSKKEEVGDNSNESSRTSSANKGTSSSSKKKKRRIICDRCSRPKPQTCICSALPTNGILLKKVEIIILQHPLEIKNHKSTANRSVPLLELCLHQSCLHLLHGRRFGKESLGKELYKKLHGHGGDSGDGGDSNDNLSRNY